MSRPPASDHEILGLRPDVRAAEAWDAYRHLADIWHPVRFAGDRYLERQARRRLAEIRAAYRRLCTLSGWPLPAATDFDPARDAERWRARPLTPAGAARLAFWWILLVAGLYVATR